MSPESKTKIRRYKMKSYKVFNGREEIKENVDGTWTETWNDDTYDNLSDILDGLADHEKEQVLGEIKKQDA